MMKKTLALVLALVMAFAMMIPAFADLTAPGSGTTIVKTTMTDEHGESAEKFTVSIPADTEIAWGAENTELTYSVESHLGYGKSLQIDVAGDNEMTYQASDADSFALPYALSGDTAFTSAGPVIYPAADKTISVDITADDWNQAVVGQYEDILTFTVDVLGA